MMQTKRRSKYTWLSIALLLFISMFYYVIELSDGGLALSVHFGMQANNIQSRSEVCTKVEIFEGSKRTHRYSISIPKTYDFYLSNGEIYRLCSFKLESMGIKDTQLRSLEGSVLTVEYVTTRILHDAYPVLSIKTNGQVIVPKQIAVGHWENAWGASRLALYFHGGFAAIILVCILLCIIVRTIRKKARLRKKRLRRKKQLEKRL